METKDKKDILNFKAFETSSYENIPLTSLVAYSVFWLSKWEIPTSLENLAVFCFKLFPSKFSMVGWSEFPDFNRINRSVLQMRPKYRNLATSVTNKGVFLSGTGIVEADSLTKRFGPPSRQSQNSKQTKNIHIKSERGSGKPRSIHPEDAVEGIKKSLLYSLFKENKFEESEAIDLIGMLGVYDHTPSSDKRRKLKLLIQQAKEIDNKEILYFLLESQQRFDKYLNK